MVFSCVLLSTEQHYICCHQNRDQLIMTERVPFPFKLNPLSQEETAERSKYWNTTFTCVGKDAVKTEPGNIILPKAFVDLADDLYNMELRPDDVWIVTYPKCGTTWAQEMIWQIVHNFDLEGGKEPLQTRFPYIESQCNVNDAIKQVEARMALFAKHKTHISFQYTNSLKSPRCIKSHLPLNMLPSKLLDTCKVIFVARNPRGVCVSYYHFHKLMPQLSFDGDFDEFSEMFKAGKTFCGNYFYHLEEAVKRKDHPNLKILWFEDMKKDLKPIIRDTAKFLGKHLTDLKVLQLDDHLYFDNFKKNSSVNMEGTNKLAKPGQSFIRKGKVGGWREHFSAEDADKFDKWIQEKKLEHNIEKDF